MRPLIKWIFNNRPLGLPPAGPGPALPPPLGLHPAGHLDHRHCQSVAKLEGCANSHELQGHNCESHAVSPDILTVP